MYKWCKFKFAVLRKFCLLYDIKLEAPFENIWFEAIHILFGYCQLMAYLFDATVSSIFIITPFSLYQFGIK